MIYKVIIKFTDNPEVDSVELLNLEDIVVRYPYVADLLVNHATSVEWIVGLGTIRIEQYKGL